MEYLIIEVEAPFIKFYRIISSRKIRAALADGDVRMARRFLGRHYWLDGRVIPGDGRGRTIGIPTANLEIWPE